MITSLILCFLKITIRTDVLESQAYQLITRWYVGMKNKFEELGAVRDKVVPLLNLSHWLYHGHAWFTDIDLEDDLEDEFKDQIAA